MEVKELTCDEVKKYYEGFLKKTLPETEKKVVAKHFAACRDCHNDFINRAVDGLQSNKALMN